jgi:hypothetical protein
MVGGHKEGQENEEGGNTEIKYEKWRSDTGSDTGYKETTVHGHI